MRFAYPLCFFIFFAVLAGIFLYVNFWKKKLFNPVIIFPRVKLLEPYNSGLRERLFKFLNILKYVALFLIIVACAGPQRGSVGGYSKNQGIDIIIALDASASMRSLDFSPLNRMEAAKKVVQDFIKERKNDRLGLVVFADFAFTQCPLTTDRDSLFEFVNDIQIGDAGIDGTALGSAVMASVNRLKDSRSKSRVIILVTDGNNNSGEIDPESAARIAGEFNIKIYTIGIGSLKGAVYEVDDPFFGKRKVRIASEAVNERMLTDIAGTTGGKYFRAYDTKSFENIMKQIDKLEKYEIETVQFTDYDEIYKYFLLPAFILLLLIIFLENTYLRKLP